MNTFQIIYVICLAAVFALRGSSPVAWVLLANLAATLAACLAMDLGWLSRDEATLTMCVIDLASGVVLLSSPGLGRIVALGYAITVPIYSANLIFGVQIGATYALVNVAAIAQVMVALIGQNSDDGGNLRRSADGADPLFLSGGDQGVGQLSLPTVYHLDTADRGGLEGGRK